MFLFIIIVNLIKWHGLGDEWIEGRIGMEWGRLTSNVKSLLAWFMGSKSISGVTVMVNTVYVKYRKYMYV